MVQQSESNAAIGRNGLVGMKLLFVKDINSRETSNKIVIFYKGSQEKGLVGPDLPAEITTRTGLSCECEGVYDILGNRYNVFSIEIPNEYNMIGVHSVKRRLYLQVINPYNGSIINQSGIRLVNLLSGRDAVSALEIIVTSGDVLNEYGINDCSSHINTSESFRDNYISQRNAKNTNCSRSILYYAEYHFMLSILDIKHVTGSILPQLNDVAQIAQLRNGRTLQRGGIGSGVGVSNPIGIGMSPYTSDVMIGSMLANLPIEVKTFKTPIQDQRLAMSDVDLAAWIGDREIVSMDSAVSDNKLIRTVVVKKK